MTERNAKPVDTDRHIDETTTVSMNETSGLVPDASTMARFRAWILRIAVRVLHRLPGHQN